MTREQAISKVTGEISAMLVKRMDDYTLRMIASGLAPDDVSEIIEEQKHRDALWLTQTLAQIRAKLLEPW